jgi:hypothetical protein
MNKGFKIKNAPRAEINSVAQLAMASKACQGLSETSQRPGLPSPEANRPACS